MTFLGPRPSGMEVCHSDGNKLNCSAENLRYGTRSDNMIDRVDHGGNVQANKTHCPRGHVYDSANTYVSPQNRRQCRACKRLWKVKGYLPR